MDSTEKSTPIRLEDKEQSGTDEQSKVEETKQDSTEGETQETDDANQGEVETLKFTPEQIEELKEKSETYKQEGKECFLEKNYFGAIEQYYEGVKILDPCPNELRPMKSIFYSNIAICHRRMEKLPEVIKYCTMSIEHDETFVKPLLNRASAYYDEEKPDKALEDIKKVKEIDPSYDCDTLYKKYEKEAQIKFEKDKEEMVGKLKDLGNMFLGKFGLSTDNFKMQQNDSGSYNIQFQQ
eukprot:CAMPEP_0114984322 /NCGR_PEP_ID=MMETSP0216-20121206/7213_1 /TAXON_ID=223996 /ORGANISM="Protocruzia adherens, Strain Boccale" /LENGTH=237 /DNA_ID=CAMNT_0002346447 /DNA_START=35 /DNA_END=748 /DNA_ORIENTATION=-